MCGIIGAVGAGDVADGLIDALRRMEYRGYDSAGVCLQQDGAFALRKEEGKLDALVAACRADPPRGRIGIGHTRWATHGAPTRVNAHPHLGGRVAAVHNGIIENFEALRDELAHDGVRFVSETDSEVIPWLFSRALEGGEEPLAAWRATVARLRGAYAVAAMIRGDESRLFFARRGSPLLLGRGRDGVFIASDILALGGRAEEVIYLHEEECGWIGPDGLHLVGRDGTRLERAWQPAPRMAAQGGKEGYAHYMEKEIHEQPKVLEAILESYDGDGVIRFPDAPFLDGEPLPERVVIVACGTSYHAALTARYWIEGFLNIPVEVDMASEYRYRAPIIGPNTWLVTISQSGETADTLEALRLFRRKTPENRTLALCNVPHSSLMRESDGTILLHAGPEIGVASTKAFTAQLAVLALLALHLARRSGVLEEAALAGFLEELRRLPDGVRDILARERECAAQKPAFARARGALYLGRGPCYPLALEGALKLKEISYLHAEGYAAGEMKHGPIALIDRTLPVVVIAPAQYHAEKVLSNLREVQARGARVILITDMDGGATPDGVAAVLRLPRGDHFTTPILAAVPLQLLAYHVARAKGTDVDQPRNLAKSVTVE